MLELLQKLFGEKQKEFIIGDRELGKNDEGIRMVLKQKIIDLYNNREMLKVLSDENQKSVELYDGGKILKEYEDYFDKCMGVNQ